jgi:TrmH family RNA methyltransferase
MKQISSVQNPLVKEMLLLREKSKARKSAGIFLIEGKREIDLAIAGNYELKTLLYCSDFISTNDVIPYGNVAEIIIITKEVYQKIAYRDTTEGIIAIAKSKNHELENLDLPPNPLVLVLESLEKPGNIGAILRTADAANIDAVIIANPKSDLYNTNIIRSSVGCLFTNQIAVGTNTEVIAFLKSKNINIYSATLQNAVSYNTQNFTTAAAIVVGTEATGLTEEWRKASKQNIIIPMQGTIDSMNVSVAAAILIYEAKRQRGF